MKRSSHRRSKKNPPEEAQVVRFALAAIAIGAVGYGIYRFVKRPSSIDNFDPNELNSFNGNSGYGNGGYNDPYSQSGNLPGSTPGSVPTISAVPRGTGTPSGTPIGSTPQGTPSGTPIRVTPIGSTPQGTPQVSI